MIVNFLVMFTYRKKTFAGNLDSITPLSIYKINVVYVTFNLRKHKCLLSFIL